MNLSPEIKAQLAEQKKQCIFCKIINKEMEGKIVFEDKLTIGLLDIYPALKGHTVFLLKEHYPIMPYIPAEEFKHYFGSIPQLSKAIKKAMLTTGINIFIANGGAAGQQSPHFLIHFLPREESDGFFNFLFKKKSKLENEKAKILAHNFPIMMNNHFSRNPASWHTGYGENPDFLAEIYDQSTILYEDEKVLAVLPHNAVVPGHIEIYSKEEAREIEKLSAESSAHLFYAASFAATAVFEGLGAHGTNIILKSGPSDDNPNGQLVLHVLPRNNGDSLQSLMWEPKEPKYDLKSVAGKIKDKTWQIKEQKKEKEENSLPEKPEVTKIGSAKENNPENEITAAIERMKS